MPSEKLEKSSKIVMQKLKMEADIPQNNSQQELVRDSEEVCEQNEKTLKDVKFREWVAVFILCFVNLINYMDRFTIAGVLSDIKIYFNIGNDLAGLLQTAFIICYMICGPLFGYLGDRYNRKWIMAAGVFLWSLTTLCGSFMSKFWWFMLFRACVGVGEASYSTIAPTIISDLFIGDVRSKMLALFYFAIPVGSGMGYIVGSETAKALGKWQWALRVTPGLGLLAVVLIVFVLEDPERGQSEGSGHMESTPWKEDIKDIIHNRSYMFSTAGFTCVAFVAGALAWWGPNFIEMGLKLQTDGDVDSDSTSFVFGLITMSAGIVGLTLGSVLSQWLKTRIPCADPLVCAAGLILSAPLLLGTTYAVTRNTALCYVLLFFGQVTLNLNWAIVSDILLYVVLPTRRSTAAGFQLLVSHMFGDAGSPYLIGVLSDAFKVSLTPASTPLGANVKAGTETDLINFQSLQYALFVTCFVEVLGGLFFLITGFYVLQDKHKVEQAVHAGNSQHLLVNNSELDPDQNIS